METIIDQLRSGSRTAFDYIYRKYSRDVFLYCLKCTSSATDAEELTQDVFVALWDKRDTVQTAATLKPLLIVMARNHAINMFRRRINSQQYAEYIDFKHELIVTDGNSSDMEYHEFEETVMKAISRLPGHQSEVFRMSRIEGLAVADIADRLGLSIQTVKNLLTMASKSMRSMLRDNGILILTFLISSDMAC